MRVFCLSLIFLAFSYSAFSQVLGAPIYNWDFANGIPETFVNASSTGICHWEYRGPNTVPDNTVCSRGSCGFVSEPITSVTASNGFVIFDSNYWDDAGPECGGNLGGGLDPAPQNAWLITEPVSLQGITGAVFTFQQQIRLFSATTKVQISTDGGNTWTDIIVNTGYNSPTAEWKTFNLYSYIGQADVRFKFSFVGMYYHWAIDDITIYQPNQNDMRLTKPRYTQFGNNGIDFPKDMEYDQYPQTMIPAFKFSGVCSNIGGLAQTGVRLSVQVINSQNNIVHTAQTNGVNLNPGAASVQTISTTYTPTTALNDYNITYKITQNQTDQNLVNNNDTLDFSITPHTYARDEGPMEDVYVPIAIYATERLELGNYFEARSSGLKFASIAVAVGTGTAPGTVIQGRVYNYEINELQAATEPYIVNIADINSIGEEKMITLPLTAPITLLKDSIYTVMVGNTDGAQPLRICRSGASPDLTSYLRYPDINGLFFLTKTPVVRMNIFPASANPGCTDPIAMNYNEGADFDDGSCDYPGCTDIEAANYDATANFDDGSCQYFGCTNPSANNYDPLATVDDGSCIIPGCTNLAADNYNPIANIDDGSCIISGCTDPEAANYNPAANLENGSCLYPGCTNPEADNYDPEATVDDGSCIISGCTNPGAANFDPTANTDDGSCILLGCTDPLADNYDPLANTDDGSCIISGCTNPLASNYNPQANTDNGSCTFPGCTDPEADNYNPAASPDDGSCIFSGCTDQDADNYDPQANNDDGSCIYYGCMDAGADNYDPSATVDDGSCIYYGCIDAQANNYDPTANTDDGSCEYSTALMQLSATEGCLPLTVTVTNQTNVQGDGTCFFEASNGETVSTCPDSFDIVFEEAGEYSITYTYTQGGVESQVVSPPIIVHETPVE
ncbi:MAG: hypothetical protein IT223_10155, partial [Crocinitomicaceae bacterium]|nr:hypothetical protein [Crocinitomicaceae bacterium]